MHINVQVDTSNSEQGNYLISCARIRDINVSSLVRRLLNRVVEDHLVEAVLDDDGRPTRDRHQRKLKKFREPHHPRIGLPEDSLE